MLKDFWIHIILSNIFIYFCHLFTLIAGSTMQPQNQTGSIRISCRFCHLTVSQFSYPSRFIINSLKTVRITNCCLTNRAFLFPWCYSIFFVQTQCLCLWRASKWRWTAPFSMTWSNFTYISINSMELSMSLPFWLHADGLLLTGSVYVTNHTCLLQPAALGKLYSRQGTKLPLPQVYSRRSFIWNVRGPGLRRILDILTKYI
jgi:hypothetical protein